MENFLRRDSETALVYLRGRIEETAGGEFELVLGDEARLGCSWLRRNLRDSPAGQQILILDCTIASAERKNEWAKDLQLEDRKSCCSIAAATSVSSSLCHALVSVLGAGNLTEGLTAAELITGLQRKLVGTDIYFQPWLAGGVIEILLPEEETGNSRQFDAGICPYMGLKAFTRFDARFFYGRKALTEEIIEQLKGTSFLAVVGASGSGKSSVVQAGVLHQLAENGLWCEGEAERELECKECWTRSFRPGNNPFQSLARVLASTTEERERVEEQLRLGVDNFVLLLRRRREPMVVLVVDQFEELFALVKEGDRRSFLQLIFGAIENVGDRLKLIVTLRGDFLFSPSNVPELEALVRRFHILVPSSLREEEYRQVIEEPAYKVGLRIEPGLPEILLKEVQNSTAALPLLEFILEQLWERRSEGSLTVEAYHKIGGLKGVLQEKASSAYEELSDKEKACAEWLFLSLIELGESEEDTRDTRRRVARSELFGGKYARETVESTLEAFIDAKLIAVSPEEQGRGILPISGGRVFKIGGKLRNCPRDTDKQLGYFARVADSKSAAFASAAASRTRCFKLGAPRATVRLLVEGSGVSSS